MWGFRREMRGGTLKTVTKSPFCARPRQGRGKSRPCQKKPTRGNREADRRGGLSLGRSTVRIESSVGGRRQTTAKHCNSLHHRVTAGTCSLLRSLLWQRCVARFCVVLHVRANGVRTTRKDNGSEPFRKLKAVKGLGVPKLKQPPNSSEQFHTVGLPSGGR